MLMRMVMMMHDDDEDDDDDDDLTLGRSRAAPGLPRQTVILAQTYVTGHLGTNMAVTPISNT